MAKDGERLKRFEQEAKATSALNHPNILTIFEFGEEDGTHYLASEFIDGETLRERLRGGPLAVSKALDDLILPDFESLKGFLNDAATEGSQILMLVQ